MPELALPQIKTRRRHDRSFKRELILRSLEPGASVSSLAMNNGINANVLFKWRREHLRGLAGEAARQQLPAAQAQALLLPVSVTPGTAGGKPASTAKPSRPVAGTIEIDIGLAQIRLHGPVNEATLRCALQTLHALA